MKTLVVFYSRTGTTKKVAEEISKALGCDIEEIIDTKDRSGSKAYLFSSIDSIRGKLTEIRPIKENPSKYELVIIGTPVWVGKPSVPVRTYLYQNKDKFKKVAFFCTSKDLLVDSALNGMKELTGKSPLATLHATNMEVKNNEHVKKVKEFVKSVK